MPDMKLTAITCIGGYWCPWFPYSLASVYNHVDEIIVANQGYNIDSHAGKNDFMVSVGPLERASNVIKRLDVNGKIIELTDIDPTKLIHAYPMGTLKDCKDGNWYDMRGLNFTAANEYAAQHGADWILMAGSDGVAYADLKGIKEEIGTYSFHRNEFAGDVGGEASYLHDVYMDTMYSDTIDTFVADLYTWFSDGGAISGHRSIPAKDGNTSDTHARKPTDRFNMGHMRFSNPAWLSPEEKFEHFYGRYVFGMYTHEYGSFSKELFEAAAKKAQAMLEAPKKPDPVKPPEVCLYRDPLEYIKLGY